MKFKSTKEIAAYFRARAAATQDLMNRELNRDKRNHYAGEVVAYHAAASVMDQVELEK